MLDISIIIVSWNARNYLRQCLESIRVTGGTVVRDVIVVDNASTDGSPDMVAQDFPEVVLIRSDKNLGFSRANNLGIQKARGSCLALVNSDVVVHPDCFQKLITYLEQRPEVGLVGPKIFGGDGRLQRSCRLLPSVWNIICQTLGLDYALSRSSLFSGREMRHWKQENEAEVEVLSGCFWLARTEAVNKVGVLDERFFFYAEDVDWCKRFRDANWKVVFFPEATATHFGGGSSSNAPVRYSIEMIRANLTYWKKHYGIMGKLLYYLLCVVHNAIRVPPLALLTVAGVGNKPENIRRLKENFYCFRWLVTGVGVSAK
ncbi:MAG: glycosyltransferase family 2 protein [Verrucomicrobiota bacterium]